MNQSKTEQNDVQKNDILGSLIIGNKNSEIDKEKNKKKFFILDKLRESDKPMLATSDAHGPG